MWGSLPPKNLFYQVDKITYFISHSEDIFPVGLIVRDFVIICGTIKWVFGTAHLPRVPCKKNDVPALVLNNISMEKKNSFLYLGMTLDNKLTFTPHVKKARKEVFMAVGGLHT